MSFEVIVDDTQETSNDHNSSPLANGSGELKMHFNILSEEGLKRVLFFFCNSTFFFLKSNCDHKHL